MTGLTVLATLVTSFAIGKIRRLSEIDECKLDRIQYERKPRFQVQPVVSVGLGMLEHSVTHWPVTLAFMIVIFVTARDLTSNAVQSMRQMSRQEIRVRS